MHRLFTNWKASGAILSSALAIGLLAPHSAAAVSMSPMTLQLTAGAAEGAINGHTVQLDEPPAVVNGKFYVPAKWVADALGLAMEWDNASSTIRFLADKAYIEFIPGRNIITVNGSELSFQSVAEIRNGRLLVDIEWLSQYADITYRFNAETNSVQLNYIGRPAGPYEESTLVKDEAQPNSRPVALFATGKQTYRLGEPVDYVDLSYDPDSEGLPVYDWTGKEDSFFTPGTHTVTLTVKDGKGNVSAPFSRTINVTDEVFVSENEYPLYFKPAGTLLNKSSLQLATPSLVTPKPAERLNSSDHPAQARSLLLGSSREPVTQKGFLTHGPVDGLTRLYPQYVNGTDSAVQFAILLRNTDVSSPVTVSTSRAAEAPISVYTSVQPHRIIEDFLGAEGSAIADMTVQPGQAVFYKLSSDVAPGQAFHGIYDISVSGPLEASYVMISPGEQPYDLGKYDNALLSGNVKGTTASADVDLEVDARYAAAPLAVGLGAITPTDEASSGAGQPSSGETPGTDADGSLPADSRSGTGAPTADGSLDVTAGVRYRLGVDTTRSTAVLLSPRDGYFQGAAKVNGNMIILPAGGLTPKDAILLHRTEPTDTFVDIELMSAGDTSTVLDVLIVPLENKQ
ncbi:stalk domain-containing protein [Paenibacillus xerothermodurans]|uniref:Copper amine oxidase N-terminal domain-containing protein n=1 Tax=Paenibacillus xerothermodurans TaxID=1977292 RepID=A0A2W1NCR6_PAEXE|nr:stalk domain-containing protein [Paenibacillus xerothermodurans]PZE21764.1 copper amine oxidase N-terminal domain-containing protein [Paenibacillus xerothermodurans]